MNEIKITYYSYLNDTETAFKNVLKYALKEEFKEEDYQIYKDDLFEDFEGFYTYQIALVEFDSSVIEYQCFTYKSDLLGESRIFYNVSGHDLCFTNASDVNFEAMDSYIENAIYSLRKRESLNVNDLCYLSATIEEYKEDSQDIIYYEVDDIEEY